MPSSSGASRTLISTRSFRNHTTRRRAGTLPRAVVTFWLMRTLLVTVLALTFSAPVLAQRPGFALGFTTSTDVYRYGALWKKHGYGPQVDYRFRLRSSAGVQAHYVTSSRFAFTAGVLLSDKGAYYDYTDYGLIIGRAGTRYTVYERRMHLDVPLKLGYNWHLTDRLSLTPTSGIIVGKEFLRNYRVTESNGDRTTRRDRGPYSGIRLDVPLELHLDYSLSSRLALSAAPYYRFDINLTDGEYGNPHSYGLLLDLRCYLK